MSTGVARVQAIVASQNGGGLPSRPAFPNSPGTVLALSRVSKAQGWGGCCFETLTAVRVCVLVKGEYTVQRAFVGNFPCTSVELNDNLLLITN